VFRGPLSRSVAIGLWSASGLDLPFPVVKDPMKKFSNMTLSLAILALGLLSLSLAVWLSPAPPQSQTLPSAGKSVQGHANLDSSSAKTSPASDPFARHLSGAQGHSEPSGPTDAAQAQGIPAGVDPFKEKLEQQARQEIASPFTATTVKP